MNQSSGAENAVGPAATSARTAGVTRLELAAVLLMFALLTGANGVRFSFNSGLPCGMLAVALLSLRVFNAASFVRLPAFAWAVCVTLVVWCIGAIASTAVHLSDVTLWNLYAGYLVPLCIFAALVNRPFTQKQKQLVLLAVALGAALPWTWGLIAYFNTFGVPTPVELFWNRYDIPRMAPYQRVAFGNTSHMGHYIAVVLPTLLVIASSRQVSPAGRALAGTASVLGVANMLVIFSRGAILTMLLVLLFWIVYRRSFRLVMAAALIGLGLFWATYDLEEITLLLVDRTVGMFDSKAAIDPSVAERLESVDVGWALFAQNPVFGVGPGMSHKLNQWSIAHQLIIEQASSIGFLGLIATTALALLAFARCAYIAIGGLPMPAVDLAIWSGILGWILYSVIAGGILHLGLLIPWAGLLYGFLGLVITQPVTGTKSVPEPAIVGSPILSEQSDR